MAYEHPWRIGDRARRRWDADRPGAANMPPHYRAGYTFNVICILTAQAGLVDKDGHTHHADNCKPVFRVKAHTMQYAPVTPPPPYEAPV